MSSIGSVRRIGQIRSDFDGDGVLSSTNGGDDKISKAENNNHRQTIFILFLFALTCALSTFLVVRHASKGYESELIVDHIVPHTIEDNLNKNNHIAFLQQHSGTTSRNSISSMNKDSKNSPLASAPSDSKREQSIDSVNLPTSTNKVHNKKTDLSIYSTSDHTPPTWDGCLYELPSPSIDSHKISKKNYDYNRKHIVSPPQGNVTLVCCNTTAGVLNIEVHPTWAPLGAQRFLEMVNTGFFSTKIGLFRALRNFLVQFGLPGDPEYLKKYHKQNLKDDISWLPLGPPGREINGTKRFLRGYLAYAGAGKNSRGTQLIMAFQDNPFLGGGSPWEVPWGQLYGEASYHTLSKIYTGYGEKPSQGKIMNRGVAYLEEEFPKLDYITQCTVIRENVPWVYTHPTTSTTIA